MNAWLLQHFFHSAFVMSGAALIASPIIIHLINRMRFRRVRFAAMEFLLQSQQRNRRRLLLEQLLLLLLRILIVLTLLALIARLVLDPSQMSIFRGAKAHHVILLDDSGSMRDQWGETTAFEQAKQVVEKFVAEGERRPNTQTFTLKLLSDPENSVVEQADVNNALVSDLKTRLENLEATHRSLDLSEGLDAVRKLFAEEKATIQNLHVVSDFRKQNWITEKALSTSVRELEEAGVSVNLVKTVSERHANLGVTDLSGNLQVAAVGVPLRLTVRVKNFGEKDARNVRLSVISDGKKLPMSIGFEVIRSGEEVDREFDVVFDSPSQHKVHVLLEGDSLFQDNARYLAIDISQANPVLIIDSDPLQEEGLFVADALAADPSVTGFAPLIADAGYLRKHPLDAFQCIFLLNIPDLPIDALEPLEEYVAAGGGLAWFVGDGVKSAFYNDKLYRTGEDGKVTGLFPVPLSKVSRDLPRDEFTNPGPDLQFGTHPIFAVFQGQENPFIETVDIKVYLPVSDQWDGDDNERKDGVATLANLRNKQPLFFEHTVGKGRVITCLTSAGPRWNNWSQNPCYVVTILELEKHIARNDRTLERRVVGQPIHLSLDPANYMADVVVSSPDSSGIDRQTTIKAAPVKQRKPKEKQNANGTDADKRPATDGELRLETTYRDTDTPGIYAVKLLDQNQLPEINLIAYNVPVEESDLGLAGNDDIRKRIGEDVRISIQEPGEFDWVEGETADQEIRNWLLILLVLLMVAEQAMAYRLSYHQKTAGATA